MLASVAGSTDRAESAVVAEPHERAPTIAANHYRRPDEHEAIALSQFVKRATFSTCERHPVRADKDESYAMMDVLNAARPGLGEAGHSPR